MAEGAQPFQPFFVFNLSFEFNYLDKEKLRWLV